MLFRNNKIYISFLLIANSFFGVTLAQTKETSDVSNFIENKLDSLSTRIETLGTFSGGDFAPFWLINNKFGLGSTELNSGYLRADMFSKFNLNPQNKDLHLSIGFDLIGAYNLSSDFYVHQLYADLKYRNVLFSVGKKERYSLFKNKDLSTGGMTLSANARPIPQVEASIPEFITLPYSKGYLQVMGGIAFGKFDDDNYKRKNAEDGYYAEKVLYHRKYGFLKYQKNSSWNVIFGAEMDTQWGGHFYHAGEYWDKGGAKLKDFFKILIPLQGGDDSNLTDRQNIVGNVYGSWHFIGNYIQKDYSIKLYHEHFFEDHSGVFFKNIPDGLYGIELNLHKKGLLTDVLFEYLHSKDQSGPFLWDQNEVIPNQVSGGDNYYNHVDYTSLSYNGFVIGNPLFTSPIYNEGKSLTVYNNRLSSFHGGVSGYLINELKYRLLITYSRSWGTDRIPARSIRNQFSTMFEATYQTNKYSLKNWQFSAAIGYDKSTMVGDNIGGQIKISKMFDIR